MSSRLTHGRAAAAALVALAVVVLAVLVAVFARGWWDGDGGTYAPPQTTVHTTVEPSSSLFGQILTARAEVVVDPKRVDPAGVDVSANLRPFHVRAESRHTRRGLGRAVVVEFEYQLQCISSACVPHGSQGGAATVVPLRQLTATFTTRDGRVRTIRAGWPDFGVQSRLTPDQLAFSTPKLDADRTPPAVSWTMRPNVLGGLALGAAVLLGLGAAGLGASVLTGYTRPARAPRLPAHMTPVDRALALAEHAARHGEVDESRKALERLAAVLRQRGGAHADEAERLAWSAGGPTGESVAELAQTVRSNGAR